MTSALDNGKAAVLDELFEAGLRFIEQGQPIIPCDGKVPCDQWGKPAKDWQNLPVTAERLQDCLRGASQPAIGMLLGPRSRIIDIETDSSDEVEAVRHLFRDCEPIPTVAYTSQRGRHNWFRYDPRLEPINKGTFTYKADGGKSVKIRLGLGDRASQSIIPPSPDRQWLPGCSPDDCNIEPLPEIVIQRLLEAARPRSAHASTAEPTPERSVHSGCLDAMRGSTKNMKDGGDGSRRLFTLACRAVEYNLPDDVALAMIKAVLSERPTPRSYSDAEILQRIRDAEGDAQRGSALVEVRSRTDMGNGERFASQHGADVRYIHPWDKWLVWNGRQWAIDETGKLMRLAKQVASSIFAEASMVEDKVAQKEIVHWAYTSQSAARLDAMLKLARSEQPIPISHESLDAHPWLLNCLNGTVDLRTGQLRPHDQCDLLTKNTRVEFPTEPGFDAALWQEFLQTIFDGDIELIRFNQRLFGASLVGEQIEHILAILHGKGANGKSVFTSTIQAALGDYAMTAPPSLLMTRHNEQHPTELADLFGKRLVVISETRDGARLDEGLVKSITGGDKIRARRMREDFWEFPPSHLPVIATNHKPVVRGTDLGIWRRLRLIPFNVTIPPEQQDKRLTDKLRAELPAIQRWLVEGCLAWQRDGLQEPPIVMAATDAYRTESDTFALWFGEHMVVDLSAEVKALFCWESYTAWCEKIGESKISRTAFGQRMGDKISGKRCSNGTIYQGVRFNGS